VNHYQFVFFNNSFFCAKQEIDSRIMKKKAMQFFTATRNQNGGGEQTQDETRQRGGGCNSYKYG
jgi:hypothetical protein